MREWIRGHQSSIVLSLETICGTRGRCCRRTKFLLSNLETATPDFPIAGQQNHKLCSTLDIKVFDQLIPPKQNYRKQTKILRVYPAYLINHETKKTGRKRTAFFSTPRRTCVVGSADEGSDSEI